MTTRIIGGCYSELTGESPPGAAQELEDTKGVIRIHKLKKDRQHNVQRKKGKRTNNDIAFASADDICAENILKAHKENVDPTLVFV
jgi:hypothetical protein